MSKKKDILLSIGLIVKNEEENLSRCLDSLKPIMEALPCQLIITDTGSTDKTVEIAKKYTDEVYSFQWCDNFAAARNYGLEKSKGQWFMFIDADEWFEDTKEIQNFFISGEYKKYINATYVVRNYANLKDKNNYEDYLLGRLYKIRDDLRFKGSIHECLPLVVPIKELPCYANHYGYAIDNSKEFKTQKHQRNLVLLTKEYEKAPDNSRWAYLISKEHAVVNDKVNFRHVIRNTYARIKDDYENEYLPYFAFQLSLILRDEGNPKGGIEILKGYKKYQKKKELWNLDILASLVDLSLRAKDFSVSLKYGKEYFELFNICMQGKLDTGISGIATKAKFINEESAVTVHNLMAQAYLYTEQFEKAVDEVMQLDFKCVIEEDLKEIYKIIFFAAFSQAQWMLIPQLYIRVLKLNSQHKTDVFREMLEDKITTDLDGYMNIAKVFNECAELQQDYYDDDYVMLQRLRLSMSSNDNIRTRAIAEQFLQKNKDELIIPVFAEFVMFTLSMEGYSKHVINKIDIEDLYLYTNKLNTIYSNLGEKFIDMFDGFNSLLIITDRKTSFWIICLMEIILVKNSNKDDVDAEEIAKLFDLYLEKAYTYMKKFYNQDLLQENNVELLPRNYRFIYFGKTAQEACDKGDYINYVKLLKKAIKHYPVMAKVVDVIVEKMDFDYTNKVAGDSQNVINNIEFELYAKNIKTKIQEIAQAGMKEEAIQLLQSYIQVNPKDKQGISQLERTLGIDN